MPLEFQTDCSEDVKEAYSSTALCGMMIDPNGVFAPCLSSSVDVQSYFEACVYDLCFVGGDEQLCGNLAALHDSCSEAGVELNTFRSAHFCGK